MADWILPYPWPSGAGLPDSPGIKNTIPAYLYDQYTDDDALLAFVDAYNSLQQQYLDWFNGTPLPIYTDPSISGPLLDWVGAGLYGLPRPTILTGILRRVGPLGTFYPGLAPLALGELLITARPKGEVVNDDVYKRILTWHFYKGDGKHFTITWLKKRVMRFLIGPNGTAPDIDQAHQISVTFGADRQANIVIYNTLRRSFSGPGVLGRGGALGHGPQLASAPTTTTAMTPFPMAQTFRECVLSGVLELPFQWEWTVTIVAA